MALITAEQVLKTLEDAVTQINTILADFDERLQELEKTQQKPVPKSKQA